MSEAVVDVVSVHLEAALGLPVDLRQIGEQTTLDSLGLDSLSIVVLLVGISEDCGVDLSDHAYTLEAPSAVGDLLAIAARFMERR
jgi:acyl carrier protein